MGRRGRERGGVDGRQASRDAAPTSRRAARQAARAGRGGVATTLLSILLTLVLAVAAGAGGAALATHWFPLASADAAQPHSAQLLSAATQPQQALSAPVRTCSIRPETEAPAALDFHGLIVDAQTGEVLFEENPEGTHPTASVMKLVTSTSALVTLGPDYRIPTRVYPGNVPGSVVIVGGGDVTLKSSATSYYEGATASLAELAAAVEAAGGATSVGYDTSVFGGDPWHPTWEQKERTDGYISPITALMTDAGRTDPNNMYSPRTTSPAQDAAADFASAVGAPLDDAVFVEPGSEPIAEVWSQPVSELVEYVLVDSDNVVAEALARLVAIERGTGNTFEAVDAAADASLEELGLDASTFVGADGSGMSRDNRASASLIVSLVEAIHTDTDGLGFLIDFLPENSLTGTLKDRLGTVPAGAIKAKTGWIDQVFALAGTMTAEDGTELIFAIFVPVENPDGSQITGLGNRNALDAIAAATWSCGATLSNY
ncbi:D-alanyl-D-alanine carboxypeptidase [Gulosibacter molinativorax]|nr:D-alanyl-D-alanine carboxypeptidase [Gulosibacter molinativorax]